MPLICFVALLRKRFARFGQREVVREKLWCGFDDVIRSGAGRGQRAFLLGVGIYEHGQGTSTQQKGSENGQ